MSSHIDDGFGNLWEIAGSYYDTHPQAPLLHDRMMIMNRVGQYYYLGIAELNNSGTQGQLCKSSR